VATARKVLSNMPHDSFSRHFGGMLAVDRAPEPADIIWENLQFSPREQLARQGLSCLILGLELGVSIFVLVNINLVMQGAEFYIITPQANNFWEFALINIVQMIVTLFGYLLIFITVPILAHKIERPHTRGAREASMMLKFSIFQLSVTITSLFVVACTATASNEDADCTLKKGWYPAGSSLLFGGLLGSIPLSCCGLACGQRLFTHAAMNRRHLADSVAHRSWPAGRPREQVLARQARKHAGADDGALCLLRRGLARVPAPDLRQGAPDCSLARHLPSRHS